MADERPSYMKGRLFAPHSLPMVFFTIAIVFGVEVRSGTLACFVNDKHLVKRRYGAGDRPRVTLSTSLSLLRTSFAGLLILRQKWKERYLNAYAWFTL